MLLARARHSAVLIAPIVQNSNKSAFLATLRKHARLQQNIRTVKARVELPAMT